MLVSRGKTSSSAYHCNAASAWGVLQELGSSSVLARYCSWFLPFLLSSDFAEIPRDLNHFNLTSNMSKGKCLSCQSATGTPPQQSTPTALRDEPAFTKRQVGINFSILNLLEIHCFKRNTHDEVYFLDIVISAIPPYLLTNTLDVKHRPHRSGSSWLRT